MRGKEEGSVTDAEGKGKEKGVVERGMRGTKRRQGERKERGVKNVCIGQSQASNSFLHSDEEEKS